MTTADVFPEFPPPLSDQASRETAKKRQMVHTFAAVAVLLATGTTITSLNKCIFAVYNFRYPLLLSALHMLTAIVVDYLLIRMGFVNLKIKEISGLPTAAKVRVFLLSLTFCATIAFGNMGLNCVQVSFAQVISTTTPLFTIAISKLFLGKHHHVLKYTAMMPICLGASFSLMGEVEFDHKGCFYIFAATMLRGVKSIQQMFTFCALWKPKLTIYKDVLMGFIRSFRVRMIFCVELASHLCAVKCCSLHGEWLTFQVSLRYIRWQREWKEE
ncbi:solute carrier family 35 member E4 isoform X3 [Narcine bancroftii]|uniref:solute carrier family 35 member E4 isoform X3 n=1 Tax=Narcine bancroftii TaxID=1343680 RepID=UPI003831E186